MSTPIQFIDLAAQRERISDRLNSAVQAVIESGAYILGPQVRELEDRLCKFGQAPHAMACANGTDALSLPLLAWNVGPGDAVFVPSFTFASTAEVVAFAGATPVFVDIDPVTYCMDPQSLESVIDGVRSEGKLKPRVVIAVDLFGQPADYPKIAEVTARHGLKLIADSAQGFGCTLNGQHPIHWADITTISFYPAKPLGCYGDGGALLCKDKETLRVIRSFSLHGQGEVGYEYDRIGINSRLDTLQAAVLLAKMEVFEDEIRTRNEAADRYAEGFRNIVSPPKVIDGGVSVWAQYTIEVDDRDAFRASLKEEGVPTAVYYPIPLHMQSPYADFPTAPDGLPVTEAAAPRVVSLPMDGYLNGERQERVIAAVRNALTKG